MTSEREHATSGEAIATPEPLRRQFQIMGTFAELLLLTDDPGADDLLDRAMFELVRLEQMLTRFDPTSPIEQLNDHGHGIVGAELQELLELSLEAFHATSGRVDVCIGADLIAAGYDRDFDLLEAPTDEELAARTVTAPTEVGGRRREPGYEIDEDGTVRITDGVRIDLGGIAKGWAADRVCAMLSPLGSCLVNLGGDISLHVAAGDEPWPIGIDLGTHSQSYALSAGGMATSGQDRRVWKVEGSDAIAHHVIDPRTGLPAHTDVLRITVIAASCAEAEVWTKALFLEGCAAASLEAERAGITAIIIGTDGSLHFTGMLA